MTSAHGRRDRRHVRRHVRRRLQHARLRRGLRHQSHRDHLLHWVARTRKFLGTRRKRIPAVGTSRHSKHSMTRLLAPAILLRTRPCRFAVAPSSSSCRTRADGLHKRMNRLSGRSTRRRILSSRDSCEVQTAEDWPRVQPGRKYRSGWCESRRRRASIQSVESSPAARLHSGYIPNIQTRSAPREARRKIVFAAKNLPRERNLISTNRQTE